MRPASCFRPPAMIADIHIEVISTGSSSFVQFIGRKYGTKNLKKPLVFSNFGGPRPSKTASKDPKRLPRGYLGLLEAILSHLGAILKTRAFKIAPASWDRAAAFPK